MTANLLLTWSKGGFSLSFSPFLYWYSHHAWSDSKECKFGRNIRYLCTGISFYGGFCEALGSRNQRKNTGRNSAVLQMIQNKIAVRRVNGTSDAIPALLKTCFVPLYHVPLYIVLSKKFFSCTASAYGANICNLQYIFVYICLRQQFQILNPNYIVTNITEETHSCFPFRRQKVA